VVAVTVTIPAGFAPMVYLTDPETEDVVWGDDLRDGMVVILSDSILMDDPDKFETTDVYTRRRLLEKARWCRITRLRRDGHLVSFIGVYEDGSQFSRTYASSWAWVVKKEST
jgi:hypothetical protein